MEIKELPDEILYNRPTWNSFYEITHRWTVLKEFVNTICKMFTRHNAYIRNLKTEIEFCKDEIFKLKYTSLSLLLHDFKYTELESLRTEQQKHLINLVKSYYNLTKEIVIQTALFHFDNDNDNIRETEKTIYIIEKQFVGNLIDYLDLKYPKEDLKVTLS